MDKRTKWGLEQMFIYYKKQKLPNLYFNIYFITYNFRLTDRQNISIIDDHWLNKSSQKLLTLSWVKSERHLFILKLFLAKDSELWKQVWSCMKFAKFQDESENKITRKGDCNRINSIMKLWISWTIKKLCVVCVFSLEK